MAHVLKVTAVNTVYSPVDNEHYLHVECDLYDEDVLVGTRSFGFPMDTTADFIKADLTRVAKTLDSDRVIAAESAELEAKTMNAELIKKELLAS